MVTAITDAADPTGNPELRSPIGEWGDMPDLVRYQLVDGPHAGEPITERGEIERLACECQTAGCQAGLDSTVIETRFNVVRSSVPDLVTRVRQLRDYLHQTRPEPCGSCSPSMIGNEPRLGEVPGRAAGHPWATGLPMVGEVSAG